MINLLPFIMVKELQASKAMIALYTTIKPSSALLSVYCLQTFAPSRKSYPVYLLVSGCLARLPFFFFPFFLNAQTKMYEHCLGAYCGSYPGALYALASMALYMMLYRSALPAWNEQLRSILSSNTRASTTSFSAASGYLLGLLLSALIGPLLHRHPHLASHLFQVSALIGVVFLFLQARVTWIKPRPWQQTKEDPKEHKQDLQQLEHDFASQRSPFKKGFFAPFVEAKRLLQKRRDFLHFQISFTMCGASVMMIYAVLAHFIVERLHVGYTEITLALAFFRALGYLLTSSRWARLLKGGEEGEIARFFTTSRRVFLLVSFFPLFLLLALYMPSLRLFFLYSAFFCYGVGLAGNYLVWHLSPAAFSSKNDHSSAPYSNVHLLAVGLRGMIFPQIGALLGSSCALGGEGVFLLSALLCLIASWWTTRAALRPS